MGRIHIFAAIFTVSLSIIFALLAYSVYTASTSPTGYQSSWMNDMWRGMDGMMGVYNSQPVSYLWVLPAGVSGIAAAAAAGLIFYLTYPEIKLLKPDTVGKSALIANTVVTPPLNEIHSMPQNSLDLIEKTMTPDERRVFEVLMANAGMYLQKYIVDDTGFSKLKVHRIVARFAERGIVTVTQSGNTNEVKLADWVMICGMGQNNSRKP